MAADREGPTKIAGADAHGNNAKAAPKAIARDVPFYNPGMAWNRDLSVLIVAAFAKQKQRGFDVADLLGGTGARSVRIANEVEGDFKVTCNDGDPNACADAKRNAIANGVEERLEIRNGSAASLLAGGRFDIVDLDPFGSPMPFLDDAVRATRHGGLLCISATDTAALAGRYPRVCERRYAAKHGLHRAIWRQEVGLRILAGAAIRSAGRHEKAARPVLCVAQGHWMRVVLAIEEGVHRADKAWKSLVDAEALPVGGRLVPRGTGSYAGPLWGGPLHDAAFVQSIIDVSGRPLADNRKTAAMLPIFKAESTAAPFWFRAEQFSPPLPIRREALIQQLQDAGHYASRTHMDPQGVRASPDAIATLASPSV